MEVSLNKILLEEVSCDLCSSKSQKILYQMPDIRLRNFEEEYTVVECRECGHRFLNPRPTKESAGLLYPQDYYADREPEVAHHGQRYQRQMLFLPKTTGRILDIGCAGGAWLKVARSKGWQCFGTDFVETGYRQKDIDIRYGYLSEIDYPDNFFDVVTAWGVMEHIHEPSAYFKTIHRILKDGGQFIFMAPNGDSLWSRWAYGEDIPRHIHFFRPGVLKRYAKTYGFEVEKIEPTNKVYSHPATARDMIRRRVMRKLGVSWPESFRRPANLGLKIISYFATALDFCLIHPRLEEKLGLCGNMLVIFKKSKIKEGVD